MPAPPVPSEFGILGILRHLQQVPQLRLFGLEIFRVVRIGFAAYWHLLHHLQAVALESDDLLRVVSQKAELTHSEIEKNLRAESVISQIAWIPEPRVCLDRVESCLLRDLHSFPSRRSSA